jgi:hypothetical protein
VKKFKPHLLPLYLPSSYYPHTLLLIMAKGKNHDRKANPDFGKTKVKSGSAKKPEFNMKRVKGELLRYR